MDLSVREIVILLLTTGIFFLLIATPIVAIFRDGHPASDKSDEILGGILALILAIVAKYMRDGEKHT